MLTDAEKGAAVLEAISVVSLAQCLSNLSDAARRANAIGFGETQCRATSIAVRGPGMNRPRVLLADDHRMFAEGLNLLLQPHFEVVGIVSDPRELVREAERHDPDVVVLEISMLPLNGIEASRQLRDAGSRAKVVFLTMHRQVGYAVQALEAGASAYVLKQSTASELVTAIEESLSGRKYITPKIAADLLDLFGHGLPDGTKTLGSLTPRQRQVLTLVTEGRSAKEIAAILDISRRTAEFHKARIIEILGVQNTVELVRYAIRTGIGDV
jgi:DNA-binding NarL/FixJ family response regulator